MDVILITGASGGIGEATVTQVAEKKQATKFERVRQSFINSGASAKSAYDHATAFLLNDAGIKLLKALNGSNDFAKIIAIVKTDANGDPVPDSDNQPIYKCTCPCYCLYGGKSKIYIA